MMRRLFVLAFGLAMASPASALSIHEVKCASQADLKVLEVDCASQAGWNGLARALGMR
ncbi:MAG: hypothetical protein RBT79_11720 [Chiayiivirga sp.]|jgi:hypothetical protein|nr:hypothetical protein [Chiayiivirga sp.]MEB2316366.1 hypothetical protein [Xanthomonadaceae bacterium]